MSIPAGPISPGTQVTLSLTFTVVRDEGTHVAILIPHWYDGGSDVVLVPRITIDPGTVI